MKILYVGPDYRGSNGTCWRDAFVALGCDVRTVDSERLLSWPVTPPERVAAKLGARPPRRRVSDFNDAVGATAKEFRPQATFFVQARFVRSETMAAIGELGPTVVYCNDDMFNPSNRTFTFEGAVRLADCLITTKSFNVPEFLRAGARRVVFQPNAFDPAIHFPARPSPAEAEAMGGDVAFLGTFRPGRADDLAEVVRRLHPSTVNVWGGGWEKMRRAVYWHRRRRWAPLRRRIRGGALWGEDMGKAIQANKLALGLLYHVNRDLHSSRSFEIPACGGFMLAERTAEHREYFEEDHEAVYFGSLDELIDKARYYLRHDGARVAIARAGHARCLKSGYRYVDRARSLLSTLGLGLR
jgi:spore maturation protein CgeB